MFWKTLSRPWQAALEMAWEGYCAGTVPIGAVVADANGKVISRGRNRTLDESAPNRETRDQMLAHAEINALLALNLDQEGRHTAALYTTMEPCPLCIGAFYMSSVRTLHFAGHDPYAGSTNLLGTTPYLSRKPIKIFPPFDERLEIALTAMYTESEIHLRGEHAITNHFFDEWRSVFPGGVDLGIALYRSGGLREMKQKSLPANLVFNQIAVRIQDIV